MTSTSRSKPMLTLGIVLCAAGVIGFVVFLVSMLLGGFSGRERVDVPGRRSLDLAEGDYTVYWESEGTVMGTRAPKLRLVIRSADGAPEIEAKESSALFSTKYSTGSRIGFSVMAFTIRTDGRYELEASAPGATGPVPGVLQVARAFGLPRLLLTILGSLAILGAGVGGGVALILRSGRAP